MSTPSLDANARMQLLRSQIRKIVLLCAPILVGIWLLSSYKDLAAAWTHHGILGVLGKVAGAAFGFLAILLVVGALIFPTVIVAKRTGRKLAAFAFGLVYSIVFCLALYGLECLIFLLAPQVFQGTGQAPLTLYQLEATVLIAPVIGLFVGWLGTQMLSPVNKYQRPTAEEEELPDDSAVV